jgi:hypothetical protein
VRTFLSPGEHRVIFGHPREAEWANILKVFEWEGMTSFSWAFVLGSNGASLSGRE